LSEIPLIISLFELTSKMEWILFSAIVFVASMALIAGLIIYKKNRELNKKFEKLKEQEPVVTVRWLS